MVFYSNIPIEQHKGLSHGLESGSRLYIPHIASKQYDINVFR